MKLFRLALTLLSLTMMLSVAQAQDSCDQHSVTTAQPSPGYGFDSVTAGLPFEIPLHFTNRDCQGLAYSFSVAFRIYSPDGATWQEATLIGLPLENNVGGASSVEDLFSYIFYDGLTGGLEDTIAAAGIAFPTDPALYDGLDETILAIKLIPDPNSAGKTICIDTTEGVEAWAWAWSVGEELVRPQWPGPICITIASCGDPDEDGLCAPEDNCPGVFNPLQADSDSDGIGDLCQSCCGLWTGGSSGNVDCTIDGKINLADITKLIDHVYVSKSDLCCAKNGNVDGDLDGKINLTDITKLIDHVYVSKGPTAPCL